MNGMNITNPTAAKDDDIDNYSESSTGNDTMYTRIVSQRRVIYGDFTTIDWAYDSAKERSRILKQNKLAGLSGAFVRFWDVCQTWLLIVVIGAITGWLAGFIDVSEQWISDLKTGYCRDAFYMNSAFCCWMVTEGKCDNWVNRSGGLDWTYFSWFTAYTTYVSLGTAFASASAVLVVHYAVFYD
jgi:chloride channel 3/4/5